MRKRPKNIINHKNLDYVRMRNETSFFLTIQEFTDRSGVYFPKKLAIELGWKPHQPDIRVHFIEDPEDTWYFRWDKDPDGFKVDIYGQGHAIIRDINLVKVLKRQWLVKAGDLIYCYPHTKRNMAFLAFEEPQNNDNGNNTTDPLGGPAAGL